MGMFDFVGNNKKKKIDDQVEEEMGSYKQAMLERVQEMPDILPEEGEFEDPVTPTDINRIRKQLLHTHKDLVVKAVDDDDSRTELRNIVQSQFEFETRGGESDLTNYILREVLTGVDILDTAIVEDDSGETTTLSPQEQMARIRAQMDRGAKSIQLQAGVLSNESKEFYNEMYDELYAGKDSSGQLGASPDRGIYGIAPSLFEDITDARSDNDTARLEQLRIQNEKLLDGTADESKVIRQNQQRLKEWLDNPEEYSKKPGSDRRISPGVPNPKARAAQVNDMLGLEEIDEAMEKKKRKERLKARRKRSINPSDKDQILALRKGIDVEDVATYDGDALATSASDGEKDPAEYINDQELAAIRDALVQAYPGLVIRGMMEEEARIELQDEVKDIYRRQTRGGQDFLVEYIVRETVGTGVIESILENDPSITDIGYDGDKLIIESNDRKYIYKSTQDINDEYIIRLVNKFAYANGRDFTGKNPVFDGKFNNIRINAMHGDNTASGKVTMALRVVRPQLALREETFETFAPMYIFQLLKSSVLAQANIMLAGETGTGKTELQKLLASFIPFNQRIVLIEDVAETFLKDMFPEKDIFSWLTSTDSDITTLVKAALRNNPRWILVSETRGAEAYEMIQAVLSGHSIITTLHAINAEAIPKRLVNMAKMGYEFSEEALEGDIRRYFDYGVHIVRRTYKGKTIRYLSELMFFGEEENTTIFRQDYSDGQLIVQCTEIPEEIKRRIKQADESHDQFIENRAHVRDINVEEVNVEGEPMRLDLSIVDGRTLTYDEVENVVTLNVMDSDKMGTYGSKKKVKNVEVVAEVAGAKPDVSKPQA